MTREEIWELPAGEEMDKAVAQLFKEGEFHIGTPPFSTKFCAAWKLVKKMINDGWAFKMAHYGGEWHVCFGRKPSFIWDAIATGPTPMVAICRAVLICRLAEEVQHKR